MCYMSLPFLLGFGYNASNGSNLFPERPLCGSECSVGTRHRVTHLDGAQLGEVGRNAAEDGVHDGRVMVGVVVGGAAEAVLDVRVLPWLRQHAHRV